MKCRRSITATERFWAKVQKTEKCWLWTGAKDGDGYGVFFVDKNNQSMKSTHFSYEEANGIKLSPGTLLMHSCDTQACIRPEHLSEGTNKANASDKTQKNRQAKGTTHGMAILTEAQVKEIRESYVPWKITLSWLARHYDLSVRQVHRIVQRKSWSHI